MVAMDIFVMVCVAGVAFLGVFFYALCRERRFVRTGDMIGLSEPEDPNASDNQAIFDSESAIHSVNIPLRYRTQGKVESVRRRASSRSVHHVRAR